MVKRFAIISVLILFCAIAWAQEIEFYVQNKPFEGKIWVNQGKLLAEAAPLLKELNVTKDLGITPLKKGETIYLPVKEVADALHLSFQYNSQTKIYDLFLAHKYAPSNSANSSQSKYNVEVTKTEEQKGIDEMAVYATLTNRGVAVPNVQVQCAFTDEDGHPLETRTASTGSMEPGASITVSFKVVYPKAANTQTYRDYNTNLRYQITLAYPH